MPAKQCPMTDATIELRVNTSIADIPEKEWDACACPETRDGGRPFNPFTTYRFLSGLERSGSVGKGTGWMPRPLSAHLDGKTIAVAPLFLKSHSQGEYVFDHAWAQAYERAGGNYYPKLQIAVPFTPVTGPRILPLPGHESEGRQAILAGAMNLAQDNGLSSVHITFCTEDEADIGKNLGLMERIGQQFHWTNQDYETFDDFLSTLSSRKRKAIRRERRGALAFGGEITLLTGDQIRPEHWDAFWAFYQSTGARKWGTPYLTRSFFDIVHNEMRDDVALVLALVEGRPVAGALNFIGRETLFGRYWGCTEHHPFLHFELCYYRAIDYAIEHGLRRVEAGAQGAHKIARGYLPVETRSLHWIADPGFADAVRRFVEEEREAVLDENEYLVRMGPFRRGG